ncbi:MAG: RluA family pseudouridine synthase [Actinomycetota bacterium]
MSESVIVPAELAGERTDRVVAVLLGVSRRVARSAVDDGGVKRGGRKLSASERLTEGDVIEVLLSIDELPVVPDDTVEFGIAYEDDVVVVVDKPAGVVVHPGAGRPGGTLANGLLARIPDLAQLGEERRWGIVHRIDRDTSGLLLIAKTPDSFDELQAALKERTITRQYRTLVAGRFTNATGTIDAPVARDPAHPTRMTVIVHGRTARTHYRRIADWEDHEVSLLTVRLETGRTHQIRVHMRAIDHPVVGDPVYGPGKATAGDPGRTWLHAMSLTFDHPSGSGAVTVHAELPADLADSLRSLGEPDSGAIPRSA